mgnify:CR=1 FL=1
MIFMSSNAAELYKLIKEDPEKSQTLFRKALQDPQGALKQICELGRSLDLPVTPEEVKNYLASIDDLETKQWLLKARGGL